MASKRLPPVDPLLVEWLERNYPNKVPGIEDSDREVWAKVGEQRIITQLRGIINRIAKENLGN
jgi:hypothetical protein